MTPTTEAAATRGPARLIASVTLRDVLKADALTSGANGAAYLLAAGPLGDLLGLSPALLRGLGVVLLAFGALVWVVATRPAVPRGAALAIAGVNAAWVAASIAALAAGGLSPTAAGTVWIVAQAIVVAGIAELQLGARGR